MKCIAIKKYIRYIKLHLMGIRCDLVKVNLVEYNFYRRLDIRIEKYLQVSDPAMYEYFMLNSKPRDIINKYYAYDRQFFRSLQRFSEIFYLRILKWEDELDECS